MNTAVSSIICEAKKVRYWETTEDKKMLTIELHPQDDVALWEFVKASKGQRYKLTAVPLGDDDMPQPLLKQPARRQPKINPDDPLGLETESSAAAMTDAAEPAPVADPPDRPRAPQAGLCVPPKNSAHSEDEPERPLGSPPSGLKAHTDRRPFSSLPLPQQAALLCADPVFRAFLSEEHGEPCRNEDDAAELLRQICNTVSRREFRPDNAPGRDFIRVRDKFQAWKIAA